MIGIILIIISLILCVYFLLFHTQYVNTSNSAPFWKNKKVLIIVPHPDDELNITGGGGLIEQFIEGKSTVFVAFATNGDLTNNAERRLNEALYCLNILGVNEEDIFFLGYGDNYGYSCEHIYHSMGDSVIKSHAGKSFTYALGCHSDYHTEKYGKPAFYTRENLRKDLEELISSVSPDILFVTDCDNHPDHRAISLLINEVVKNLISLNQISQGLRVFRTLAYSLAFHGIKDYYNIPFSRTASYYKCDQMQENISLFFSQRMRVPNKTSYFGYTKRSSRAWRNLMCYNSQAAVKHLESIVNSDLVYWEERMDNLALLAHVNVSSGNGNYINDNKIMEYQDVRNQNWNAPCNGWIPEETDLLPYIEIIWDSDKTVKIIEIYPIPNNKQIIETLCLQTFDTEIDVNMNSTRINEPIRIVLPISKRLSRLRFIIKRRPKGAGISEIRVFDNDTLSNIDTIKLVDNKEEFIYNILIKRPQVVEFKLFANNRTLSHDEIEKITTNIEVITRNKKKVIHVELRDNKIVLSPTNVRKYKIIVRCESGGKKYSDEAQIIRPYAVVVMLIKILVKFEQIIDIPVGKIENKVWHLKTLYFKLGKGNQ